MKVQIRVKDNRPAGNEAWMDTMLCRASITRSTNCISENEPVLMISGYAMRSTSR
jgi:hypothetical protein